MLKQKVRKSMYESVAEFMPVNMASEYLRRHQVVRVELDFRLILTNLQVPFTWPNVEGAQFADNVSLRLMWSSPTLYTKTTNIDDGVTTGIYDGNEFLLWQIDKLTPQGGELAGKFVKSPFVELVQVKDLDSESLVSTKKN